MSLFQKDILRHKMYDATTPFPPEKYPFKLFWWAVISITTHFLKAIIGSQGIFVSTGGKFYYNSLIYSSITMNFQAFFSASLNCAVHIPIIRNLNQKKKETECIIFN
jgi:hypothetical protein